MTPTASGSGPVDLDGGSRVASRAPAKQATAPAMNTAGAPNASRMSSAAGGPAMVGADAESP